jgi:small multidrug resistance family-3 protein
MSRITGIAVLLLAALLEAGGDALMRVGLHKHLPGQRALFFALAAGVLFAYGWTVNAPSHKRPCPARLGILASSSASMWSSFF